MAEIEKNKYGIGEGDEHDNTQLSFFSFKDVLTATDNFSESNKLGEGGFGPVYKGKLSGDQEVAMKRLSKKSGQGLEEFMNELKLIAKLQHTYLVRLLGCCVEREEKILIYEYMPNRSLDKFLFGSSDKAKLDWGQRVKIAEGVAQGLLYIHKYSRLKIIHRDMKASNVLLDAAMNPKISDFGMARIFGIDQDEANTNHIVGTYGYMSPEYAFYGQFSEKSDVFSFGVLLLEIVSGKRNKDFYHNEIPYSLLCWVWEIWKEGKPEELIDPIVKNSTCCNLTEEKLTWGQRVKIAEGVAQGLLYIHRYSRLKIIHRDMKASNVLLDAAMNPKISDFGMARIFGTDQDEANTNRIVGTYGYMSPEYTYHGQFSEKSDVFSFGVLLLEIVSGKRNKDFYHPEIPSSLLCWVWELWKEGKPEELIDPAVKNTTCCNLTEAVKFIHVGLLCVQEAPIDRPTMASVTQMLSSNDSQSFTTPGELAFITRRAIPESSYQVPMNCSNNQITVSFPSGRL
ncbi:Cysteine-rich receptor-like protein kinase 10 [Linum perenne]